MPTDSYSAIRSRRGIVLISIALASATAIGARLFSIDAGQSQVLELSLGVFAGFATALTFALALLATTVTQWPPITVLILRPPLLVWAALSVLSVSFAFVDSFSHHVAYAVTALTFTTAAASIGVGALVDVLAVVGGSERIRFHGGVLARGIRRMSRPNLLLDRTGARRLYDDFLSSAATYASTSTTNLICSLEILINAAEAFVDDGVLENRADGEAILRLLLEFQLLLPASMRRGEALDELAMLLERASSQVAVISGRLPAGPETAFGPTPACWLAAQTRTHNWTATCVAALAEGQPNLVAQCERVIDRVRDAQTIILRCVDPDPPLEIIPLRHPWHRGVRDDPLGLMVWFSTAFEYHGILDNNAALYVAHESLLGEKTTGDYNYGHILYDVELGVERNAALWRTFSEFGGFTELLLDNLANCLATCSRAAWRASQNTYAGDGWVTERARAQLTRTAWIIPRGSGAPPTADSVLTLVTRALSRENHIGFERYRRERLGALDCELEPPWSRVCGTPIFHVASGALMLAPWAEDPLAELVGFAVRIGDAARRSTKAAIDDLFCSELAVEEVKAKALDTRLEVSPEEYASGVLSYLEALR
jgi:hypothetical protein